MITKNSIYKKVYNFNSKLKLGWTENLYQLIIKC